MFRAKGDNFKTYAQMAWENVINYNNVEERKHTWGKM